MDDGDVLASIVGLDAEGFPLRAEGQRSEQCLSFPLVAGVALNDIDFTNDDEPVKAFRA